MASLDTRVRLLTCYSLLPWSLPVTLGPHNCNCMCAIKKKLFYFIFLKVIVRLYLRFQTPHGAHQLIGVFLFCILRWNNLKSNLHENA